MTEYTFWGKEFVPENEMFTGRKDKKLQEFIMDFLRLNFLREFQGLEKEAFIVARNRLQDTFFWQSSPSFFWGKTFRLYLQELLYVDGEITSVIGLLNEDVFQEFIKKLVRIKSRALLLPVLLEEKSFIKNFNSIDRLWGLIPIIHLKGIPLYPATITSLLLFRLLTALLLNDDVFIKNIYVYSDEDFIEDISSVFYIKKLDTEVINTISIDPIKKQKITEILYSLYYKLVPVVVKILPFRKGKIASYFLPHILKSVYYKKDIKELFELTGNGYLFREIAILGGIKINKKPRGFLFSLSNESPDIYELYEEGEEAILNALINMIETHNIEDIEKSIMSEEGISPRHSYFKRYSKSMYYGWKITELVYEAFNKGVLEDIIKKVAVTGNEDLFLLPLLMAEGKFELVKKRKHANTEEILKAVKEKLKDGGER